jgi:hypothetical protein
MAWRRGANTTTSWPTLVDFHTGARSTIKTSRVVEQTTQRGEPGGGGAASSSSSSSKSTVRVGSGALKGACTGASFAGASTAAARLSSSSSLEESPPVGGSAFFRAGAAARGFSDLPPGRRRAGRSTGRAVCEEFRLRRGIRYSFLGVLK